MEQCQWLPEVMWFPTNINNNLAGADSFKGNVNQVGNFSPCTSAVPSCKGKGEND